MSEWYLLPGMGATARMYQGIERHLRFSPHFLDWPVYRNETTFQDVARRVVAENQINGRDVVGGSSLGGMIALEVAMIVKPKAVVLLGSAISPDEVSSLLSRLSRLSAITPFSLLKVLSRMNGHILCQMFAACDPAFVRAMCRYIFTWHGYHGSMDKIYRIHGRKDTIIAYPKFNCQGIENAGHFPTITHPEACAAFIEKTRRLVTSLSPN